MYREFEYDRDDELEYSRELAGRWDRFDVERTDGLLEAIEHDRTHPFLVLALRDGRIEHEFIVADSYLHARSESSPEALIVSPAELRDWLGVLERLQ
jgi:hypothetical protein